MFFLILLLIFTALYSYLLTLSGLSLAFLALWIPLGLILAILTILIMAYIFLLACPKKDPMHKFRHFILRNAVIWACWFLHVKIEAEGQENIPTDKTFVVYANHKSNMDPVIIYLTLHRLCTAIGKKSLFKNYFMRLVAQVWGAIPIDRDNDREAAKTMVRSIKHCKEGWNIIIFPEGGIKSRDCDEMVNLRAGAYKLAMKANALILPVSIIGSAQISKLPKWKRKVVKVIYHKPVEPSFYEGKNTTEVGLYVEDIINEGVKNAQ